MKILHVSPYYLPAVRYGGPVFSISGLCRELVRKGHEVHVYTTSIDGKSDLDVPLAKIIDVDGVKVTYFPSPFLRKLFWSPQLERALKRNIKDFDLVHLHSVFVWPTSKAAEIARKAGVPYILAPRGMLEKNLIRKKSRFVKSIWMNVYGKRVLSGAARVHLTSKREAEELKKFNSFMPPIALVPNGIDIHSMGISAHGKNIDFDQYVLFLSRISWEKGLERIICAWKYDVDIPLIIAGPDDKNYTPKLKRLAHQQGVSDKIHFIGPVAGEYKWDLLQRAKMMVLPSYSENFGNVVLEAMALSCPVVVTPEVGLSDVVADTGSGVVVEGEPELLAKAIKELLGNEKQRLSMGANGREAVEKHFSWPAVAESMEHVYREVVQEAK